MGTSETALGQTTWEPRMWANPASVLERALPRSSPFHLPLILPGFCSRAHLPESADAGGSVPRRCEVCRGCGCRTGPCSLLGSRDRSWHVPGPARGAGAANERPWAGAAAVSASGGCSECPGTVQELRIRTAGAAGPGLGLVGKPPELPSVPGRAGREQIEGRMEMHN